MATQNENAVINLVINGQQAINTYRELNAARAEQLRLVQNLNRNAPNYQEQSQRLNQLTAAQSAWRAELMQGSQVQKGFFADFKQGFSEIGEMIGKITAGTLIYKGISAAIEGIKDLFNGSQAAYEEAQKTQTQLQQVLKSTGAVAGETQKQLEAYQQALMNQTGIDDDVIAKGEEMLLTFTNIRGKIYEQALPAIVDMTSALNQGTVTMEGIQATAIQVGKALNDPINGATALKKVGVTLDDQQKQQIKTMQESNNMMGAQSIILKELQKEFGGTAEAIANTDVGKLQKFATAWDNLKEKIGEQIVAGKSWLADFFQPFVDALIKGGNSVKNLTDDFYKQRDAVQSLEKNTQPLIARYDELKSKGELNKKEQVEMNKIINTLAETIPTAVTEWDKYGNALGINTDKAREFIKMQQAMLKIKNKDAIDESEATVNSLEARANRLQGILTFGKTNVAGGRVSDSATDIPMRDLTPKEITDYSNQLKKIKDQVDDLKLGIKGLKGENVDIPDTKVTPPKSGPSQAELDKQKREAEKRKKDQEAALAQDQAISDSIKEFNAAELADTLSKNDKEVAALENKYDKEINAQQAALKKYKENKYADDDEVKKHQSEIDALQVDKQKQVVLLRAKQEQDLTDKIAAFNQKLTGKLETELQKERDNINAYFDGLVKDAGSNKDQIATIEQGRAVALADAKINEEKRFQEEKKKIAAEGLVDSADKDGIELAKLNKKYDDEIDALKQKFSEEFQATQEFQDAVEAINTNRKNAIDQSDADKTKKKLSDEREFAIQAAQDVSNAIFTIGNRNRQADTDAKIRSLETQKANELDNKNLTEAQKNAINDKYAKQEADIKRKAWKADQDAAVEQAIINGALAVVKALAQVGPLGAFVIPGIIATTALQVATIEAQKPPEFAEGGIPNGPSHAEGGMNLVGPYGQIYGQIEGGEPVLSKKTYANNKEVIDALLNSGGQPLNYDRVSQATTDREARRTVSTSTATVVQPATVASTTASNAANTSSRLDRIEKMIEKQLLINEIPIVLSRRVQEQEDAKVAQVRNDANA